MLIKCQTCALFINDISISEILEIVLFRRSFFLHYYLAYSWRYVCHWQDQDASLMQAFTAFRIVADLIRRLSVETAHCVHVRVQVISLTVLLTLIASQYYTRVRIYKVKYVILQYIASFAWLHIIGEKRILNAAFWSFQRKIESCDILWY